MMHYPPHNSELLNEQILAFLSIDGFMGKGGGEGLFKLISLGRTDSKFQIPHGDSKMF
eukprot:c50123_g1_i1 orf=267-440(-)